jgi:hypothetical protein
VSRSPRSWPPCVSIPQYRSGQLGPDIDRSSQQGSSHISIPQYRSGQFRRQRRPCGSRRRSPSSQSLNTDQGSSDTSFPLSVRESE